MSAPSFQRRAPLFEIEDSPAQGGLVVFGVPYDGTTSFRPGTRSGPDAIRDVSEGLEYYSPEQDADLEDLHIADLGNLDIPFGSPGPVMEEVRKATSHILQIPARPVMLGGEHSLTPAAVEVMVQHYPDLAVIQLDAHADLRASYLGEAYSHACAMRRCLDVLKPGSLLQVGIRSGTREEFREMRDEKRLVPPTPSVMDLRIRDFKKRPVYLSIDLDIFDPACFPGTGTPEPGGIDWQTFAALLEQLSGFEIVGADIMELSPALDPSGCSSVLAAKVLREVLLKMGTPQKGSFFSRLLGSR